MSRKNDRRLEYLPDYDAELPLWRDWLTEALAPHGGFRFADFVRHGRQRVDSCELVLLIDDKHVRFTIGEQRELMSHSSLRSTLLSVTDGLVRLDGLGKPELEDVWAALATIARVTADQDLHSETRDWMARTARAAWAATGFSLTSERSLDALLMLRRRRLFDRRAALDYLDPNTSPLERPSPVVLVDEQTHERWMRVSEVAAFVRHVLDAPPMSYPTLTGRLSAIGVDLRLFERNTDSGHGKAQLYRVPTEFFEDDAKPSQ